MEFVRVRIGFVLLAAGLAGCDTISENYSEDLKPSNVVTYATTGNRVIRKMAHFVDRKSNIVTLTDDASDGLLPHGDKDRLIDRVSLETYQRNLLFDYFIKPDSIYADHLAIQDEEFVRDMDRQVIEILTDKFLRQNDYFKTASSKTEYELWLKSFDPKGSVCVIGIDGIEAEIRKGAMQKVNSVYVMLDHVVSLGVNPGEGFAVIRISNQAVLLFSGQKTRILVNPAESKRRKLAKKEVIHYLFVVGDTIPDRETCELEDIFHSFLVDEPGREHVCHYRLLREMERIPYLDQGEVAGYRTMDDPFEGMTEETFMENVKDTFKDFFRSVKHLASKPSWMPGRKKETEPRAASASSGNGAADNIKLSLKSPSPSK